MKLLNALLPLALGAGASSLDQKPQSQSQRQLVLAPARTAAPLEIPLLGFGTWNLKEGSHNASKAVAHAIKTGYRHIDCAAAYGNERDVGRGIARGLKAAGLERAEIHVTSKLWNTDHNPKDVEKALDQTLFDLGLDYLDLYLMHWPVTSTDGVNTIGFIETWKAMIALLPTGKTRRIGVCNFSPDQLQRLIAETGVAPAVHQMELHPYLPQADWVLWHQAHGIHVTAYSPLGNMNPTYGGGEQQQRTPRSLSDEARALPPLLENGQVEQIARDAGCPVSNVPLAWGMYRGTSVIPKSQHLEYIEENFRSLGCDLSYANLRELSAIGVKPHRFNNPSKGWGVSLYDGLEGV